MKWPKIDDDVMSAVVTFVGIGGCLALLFFGSAWLEDHYPPRVQVLQVEPR